MATDVVQATSTFHYGEFGQLFEGELWAADDPLVKAHPEWFTKDLQVRRSVPPVETATAAPGEKRAVTPK